MMKAEELKKGNWVQWNHKNFKDYFFKVTDIGLQGVNYETNHFRLFSALQPIELTEEILLKCGFERIENNWKVLDVIFASLSWERLAGMTLTLEHESIFIPHIKYLHQLQNLYFMLCNEELEIKL